MSIAVYGRRKIRRIEQATCERIVHAAGIWATTIDHRHLEYRVLHDRWEPLPPLSRDGCALPLTISSCLTLFGADHDGIRRHFMLGACDRCHAQPAQPHRHDCPTLIDLLGWRSINPDYYPQPVHQPLWMTDRRRIAGARS